VLTIKRKTIIYYNGRGHLRDVARRQKGGATGDT